MRLLPLLATLARADVALNSLFSDGCFAACLVSEGAGPPSRATPCYLELHDFDAVTATEAAVMVSCTALVETPASAASTALIDSWAAAS